MFGIFCDIKKSLCAAYQSKRTMSFCIRTYFFSFSWITMVKAIREWKWKKQRRFLSSIRSVGKFVLLSSKMIVLNELLLNKQFQVPSVLYFLWWLPCFIWLEWSGIYWSLCTHVYNWMWLNALTGAFTSELWKKYLKLVWPNSGGCYFSLNFSNYLRVRNTNIICCPFFIIKSVGCKGWEILEGYNTVFVKDTRLS